MIYLPIPLNSARAAVIQHHGRERALTAEEVSVVDFYAEMLIGFIQERWPVKTGRSRDAWRHLVNPSGFRLILINDASDEYGEYAEFVHYAGNPIPLVQSMVRDAIALFRDGLNAALDIAIQRTEINRQSGPGVMLGNLRLLTGGAR